PLVADPGPELAGLRRAVAVPPVPAGPLGLAEEHAELVAALRRDPDERRPLRGPPLDDALRPAGRRRLRPGGDHLGGAQPHLAALLAERLVDALEGFAQVVQAAGLDHEHHSSDWAVLSTAVKPPASVLVPMTLMGISVTTRSRPGTSGVMPS